MPHSPQHFRAKDIVPNTANQADILGAQATRGCCLVQRLAARRQRHLAGVHCLIRGDPIRHIKDNIVNERPNDVDTRHVILAQPHHIKQLDCIMKIKACLC